MVVGLGAELLERGAGEPVAVDGAAGTAALAPAALRRSPRCARQPRSGARMPSRRGAERALPSVTRDGRAVRVLVNAATPAELERGIAAGAEGVGLLRTELAFLDAPAGRARTQHRAALAPVLGRLAGRTATVRVLDFGGDKTPPFLRRHRRARARRCCSTRPTRSAHSCARSPPRARRRDLRVLLPMVESRRRGRDGARDRCRRSTASVGAMIETRDAPPRAPASSPRAADFLSIGTNDLTHAVLGTDRFADRRRGAHHPRVLAAIAAASRRPHARRPHARGVRRGGVGPGAGAAAGRPRRRRAERRRRARRRDVRALVRSLEHARAQALAQRALAAPDAAAVAALVGEAADADGERVERGGRVVAVGPQA